MLVSFFVYNSLMQRRVFLVHGWGGRSDNHWFPYLKWELIANGFEVYAPQMPSAAEPKLKEWLDFLKDYVGKLDTDTYFVGHSLGCITIARYLASLHSPFPKGSGSSASRGISKSSGREDTSTSFKKGGIKVGGCVFVAGFSGRLNIPEIREFYELPFDPEKAKQHCDKFVMIFSDNDHAVPMEKSLEFAKQLGARTILERGKDHFSDGLKSLPSALQAILKISS